MTSIFLFDVDGTLTLPRKKMTTKFAKLFDLLVDREEVYLVSGSDIEKIREQVPHDILNRCRGVFASSANEFWIHDNMQYKNTYVPSVSVLRSLAYSLELSEYGTKAGKHVEHRPGMINFSTVGRAATDEQRSEYSKWDKRVGERKNIVRSLKEKHPELDAKIGGEISIDIYPIGLDKSQAVHYLRTEFGVCQIIFFGDRTDEEGNDYSVVEEMTPRDIVHAVKSCEDTYKILKNYLGYEDE